MKQGNSKQGTLTNNLGRVEIVSPDSVSFTGFTSQFRQTCRLNWESELMEIVRWFVPAVIVYAIIFYSVAFSFAGEVDLTKAVIHHTASGDVSASTIDAWHKERKDENGKFWKGIGYHFVIRQDGTVETGRSLEKRGAHARGRNHFIGIALTGNNDFTTRQYDSLIQLLKRLGVRHIERHHELCPGSNLNVEAIQKELGDL